MDIDLCVTFGLNPNPGPFRTRLKPGETSETPRIFLGASGRGLDATANILRTQVREVLATKIHGRIRGGGGMRLNKEIAHRMIRDSAELGFEMSYLDAGWFP